MSITVSAFVNSAGLVLDIIGAIFLFIYGVPEHIDKYGHIFIISDDIDEGEKMKWRKYDCWAKFGVGLLILGFVLQLLSNFLN